ncbi:MAG: N-6 DNA methylase [Nitrospirota bacterium]
MTHLIDLFHEVNTDLNGDIFKPHACEKADVDSGLLADIIESLYFPKSRYRFDAIGVELLGNIYERYLGSTIRVTPRRVKVEEKPEVRKAGGVYYTPKYIVDYIVKNTVGKIIEGKTLKQIEKIKILDPACGSGSFLLGAYQYLIDYHLKHYREHPKEVHTLHLFPYYKISPEELSLPLREKAKILKNNIFGVDIDPQAVEITMMSLYLKVLEGERGLLPKKQQLLPPLSNNIKCGNSLIGYDILDSSLFLSLRARSSAISDETISCINPFDWNSKSTGFGEIMESGGFDIVIGNPPYVVLSKEGFDERVIQYLGQNFKEVTYQLDSYLLFMVQAARLSKNLIGFIVPNAYLGNLKIVDFRKWLLRNTSIKQIVMLPPDVFEGAVVDTTIVLFSTKASFKNKIEVLKHENEMIRHLYSLQQSDFLSTPEAKINIHIEPSIGKIIDKVLKQTQPLYSYLEINRGVLE